MKTFILILGLCLGFASLAYGGYSFKVPTYGSYGRGLKPPSVKPPNIPKTPINPTVKIPKTPINPTVKTPKTLIVPTGKTPKTPINPKTPIIPTGKIPKNGVTGRTLNPTRRNPLVTAPPSVVQKGFDKSFGARFRQGVNVAKTKTYQSYRTISNAAQRSWNRLKIRRQKLRPRPELEMRLQLDKELLDQGILPPVSGGPPAKKSKFAAAKEKVIAGLHIAGEVLPTVTNVAGTAVNAVMSVKNLEVMQGFITTPAPATAASANENDPQPGTSTGTSTDVNKPEAAQPKVIDPAVAATCPKPVDNMYVSEERQKCAEKVASTDSTDSIKVLGSWYRSHDPVTADDTNPNNLETSQTLKYGTTLVLEILDYIKFPLDGRYKQTTCRKQIVAVSDKRKGYTQTLEIKPISEISDVQTQRSIALICATDKVPMVSLKPGQRRLPGRQEKIPEVKADGVTKLEWRGLMWQTPKVTNACHFTSFITFFLFNVRRSNGFMTRNLISIQDGPENVLKDFYGMYMGYLAKQATTHSKFDFKSQQIHDENIKKMWIEIFFPDKHKRTTIDFRGSESASIGEKLENSLFFFVTYHCQCTGELGVKARRVFMPPLTMNEVITMSRINSKDLNEPLNLVWEHTGSLCETCTKPSTIDFLYTPHSTWCLFFQIRTKGISSFDINIVPTKFVAHELFADNLAEFELGYLSFSTTVMVDKIKHHVSIMFFNEKFYYYDDLANKGELILCDPNEIFKTKKLDLTALIFFRR